MCMYIREFNMQTWVINLKVVVYRVRIRLAEWLGHGQMGWDVNISPF